MAYFEDLSDFGLPPHWNMSQSLSSNSSTLLVKAQTGSYRNSHKCLRVCVRACVRACVCVLCGEMKQQKGVVCVSINTYYYSVVVVVVVVCLSVCPKKGERMAHFAELDTNYNVSCFMLKSVPFLHNTLSISTRYHCLGNGR